MRCARCVRAGEGSPSKAQIKWQARPGKKAAGTARPRTGCAWGVDLVLVEELRLAPVVGVDALAEGSVEVKELELREVEAVVTRGLR